MLQEVGRIGWLSALPRALLLVVGLALQVGAYGLSSFTIDKHPSTRTYVARTFREMQDAVAASPGGTTVYIENGETQPVLGPSLTIFLPGRAGMFLFPRPTICWRVDTSGSWNGTRRSWSSGPRDREHG